MKTEEVSLKSAAKRVRTTKGEVGDIDASGWNYLTRQLKVPQVEVIKMKVARYPARVKGRAAVLSRYFNSEMAQEKGLTIDNYEALNEHPELILYEGYRVPGKDGEINIRKWEGSEASLLREKAALGEITEAGIVIDKPPLQRWLGRLGGFMMMGGFIVVLVLIVAIAIGISIAVGSC